MVPSEGGAKLVGQAMPSVEGLVPKVVTVRPWVIKGWWFDDGGELHYRERVQGDESSYIVNVPVEWV